MITIYGASDDLIEVEGDIREEFNHYESGPALIACSDGTLVRVAYEADGIWRCTVLVAGVATAYDHTLGQDDRDYSDRLTLHADVRWVVYVTGGRGDNVGYPPKKGPGGSGE